MRRFKLPRLRQMRFTQHGGAVFTCRGDVVLAALACTAVITAVVLIVAEFMS